MEMRSRYKEQQRIRRIRGRITAVLTVLLIAVLILFLLTLRKGDQSVPENSELPSGEIRVAQADRSAGVSETMLTFETASAVRSEPEPESPRTLACPLVGTLTSAFGYREDPFTGQTDFHPAVDLAAPEGTPIGSAADGLVLETGRDPVYGKYVRVWHGGGLVTQYGHCSKVICTVGETVRAGETIALVGQTGRATGCHLDFQVLLNGENVDPAPWIGL